MTPMTSRDRAELGKLLRMRAKVTKAAIDQQQAAYVADVEAQLSAQYKFDDDKWQDVTKAAQEAVAKADAEIAKRCKALGIAEKLRPSISISWMGRGDNYLAARRAELRMSARTRIEELA
jgi:fructoselysine-6-P-deglycase FrlB-like protein